VSLLLPASKTDIGARGCARNHCCSCGRLEGAPALLEPQLCPHCALVDQQEWALQRSTTGDDGPLFPTLDGGYPSKQSIVLTIVQAANLLQLPLVTESGCPRWGGHALRRGGAQYLAESGVEVWRIQALARHSSAAILLYLGDSHISSLRTLSAEAAAGRSLDAVREELRVLHALVAQGKRQQADVDAALQPRQPADHFVPPHQRCHLRGGPRGGTSAPPGSGRTIRPLRARERQSSHRCEALAVRHHLWVGVDSNRQGVRHRRSLRGAAVRQVLVVVRSTHHGEVTQQLFVVSWVNILRRRAQLRRVSWPSAAGGLDPSVC